MAYLFLKFGFSTSFKMATAKSSMEILASAGRKNIESGMLERIATAFFTFVSRSPNEPLPPVIPESDSETEMFLSAKTRRDERRNGN